MQSLRQFIDQFDSVAAAARELGVSRQYLNDVVNLKKDISRQLLAKLGLKHVIVKREGVA